jgi:hypothetical protein
LAGAKAGAPGPSLLLTEIELACVDDEIGARASDEEDVGPVPRHEVLLFDHPDIWWQEYDTFFFVTDRGGKLS